ncbi:endonuclease V [Candidatus Bathyarchaeota archaeon]|nr:MAG: endonuclease V [Candidatus Bathyarchaeota archaeon]
MELRTTTNLTFSIEEARRLQTSLSKRVVKHDDLPRAVKYVAGVDVAYIGNLSIGAVAVLDLKSWKTVEIETSLQRVHFPYIPTLLSFREMQPAISAIRKLRIKPDVFLIDGHGLAHPYRLGFASHLGVMMDSPTIGVAKGLLCGEVKPMEGYRAGDWSPIIHNGEVIGAALITRAGAKPVYVSIGHRVSLETAIRIVMDCVRGYRIPEPIRRAHIFANRERIKLINEAKKVNLYGSQA